VCPTSPPRRVLGGTVGQPGCRVHGQRSGAARRGYRLPPRVREAADLRAIGPAAVHKGRQPATAKRVARMSETTRPSPDGPRAGAAGPNEPAGRDGAGSPAETGGGLWRAAAKRTLGEFADDQLSDRAAALTYYAVLSIFPGILVVVSLLGLLG